MKRHAYLLLAVGLGLTACTTPAASTPSEPPTQQPEELGTVSFTLTGAGSDGVQYRLRNADFRLVGYADSYDSDGGTSTQSQEVISTESDPDAAVITRRVIPGSYYVSLLGNRWYLEKVTADGAERVEQAILLSERNQYAYVWNGSTTEIVYRFGVDGTLIDFRNGDINIGIEIERPGDPQNQYDAGVYDYEY